MSNFIAIITACVSGRNYESIHKLCIELENRGACEIKCASYFDIIPPKVDR